MYLTSIPSVARSWRDLERLADQVQRHVAPVLEAARDLSPCNVPVNLWANTDALAITAELPGVQPDQVHVALEGTTVTIEVTAKDTAPADGTWLRRERRPIAGLRRIDLPYRADPEHVEAGLTDGVLTIGLRRLAADRPRQIPVNAV